MGKRISAVILCLGSIFSLGYPAIAADGPASSIDVTIPEYEVEQIEGYDYVDIPGGDILLVDGKPRIPYYPVSINYPEGYRVQNVVTSEKSGLTTATGLNLPVVVMQPDKTSNGDITTPPIEQEGWYPEEDFSWEVLINSDGSSSLVIAVYPFYSNAETTDIRFYRNYRFDIDYIHSSVEIIAFDIDSYIYTPGSEIVFDVRLMNSGDIQDVVISLAIKSYISDELIDGLPIRSLKGLAGEGSYSDTWDTTGTSLGDYYAEAVVTDTYGNIIDSETIGFSIQLSEIVEIPPETTWAPTSTITETTETTVKADGILEEPGEFPTIYLIIGAILVVAVAILILFIRSRMRA